MNYLNETKNFGMPTINVAAGSYAHVDDTGNVSSWQRCREAFHNNHPNIKCILFAHKKDKSKNIAAFILKLEKNMKHSNLSKFGKTTYNRSIWIEPAPFWNRNNARKSLFTILLRCGQDYDIEKDNFEEALYKNKYVKETKIAVQQFINGYTWYKGENTGWRNKFRNMSAKDIETVLTKKPISEEQLLNFACLELNVSKKELEKKYRKTNYPLEKVLHVENDNGSK